MTKREAYQAARAELENLSECGFEVELQEFSPFSIEGPAFTKPDVGQWTLKAVKRFNFDIPRERSDG